MKVLMINVVCGIRSTGRICTDLATALEAQGHEVKIAYGREHVPEQFQKYAVRIGNDLDVKLHGVKARLFDAAGFGSKAATKRFIEWVKEYDPDVIHLHNIHGYYINIEVLFDYLKTCGKKIIWTLHDCWAFTGHAAYCEAAGCKRWKTGCDQCPKKNDYPKSLLDRSIYNWKHKNEIFSDVPHLQIVTPSKWLAGLVTKSFLSQYPVTVIYNGIDTDLFKPAGSDLRERLDLGAKKVILGVAAIWDERKGLNDFLELSKKLDSAEYQIILVGLSKEQVEALPDEIIGITRTDSVQQLVQLYSLADVFVNPTYEDNYPTTNLEAIACGTPVITYDTGGSPESARMYGAVVEKGEIDGLLKEIDEYKTLSPENVNLDYSETVLRYITLIENNTILAGEIYD